MNIATNVEQTLWGLYFYTNKSTASQCVHNIMHWLGHHGPKWTFVRLEALAMELIGGEPCNWAKDANSHVRGPFGHIQRLFYSGTRKQRRNILRSLRIGGLFVGQVTKSSYLDLACKWEEREEVYSELPFNLPAQPDCGYRPVLRPMSGRAFTLYGSKPCATARNLGDHVHLAPNLCRRHEEFLENFMAMPAGLEGKEHMVDIVGSVSLLTKDRKLKLRPVFNPGRLFQLALEPLSQSLEAFASRFSEYTLDQRLGVVGAQELLRQGYSLGSIDLEAASDNIPLGLQLQMLEQLFPYHSKGIELFGDVSRAWWKTPYEDILVRMRRGQPLGLRPSFLSFSVLLMLYIRFYFLGPGKFLNPQIVAPFFIVGDDIVTADSHRVQQLLSDLAPIQFSKTVHGDIAMFGGQLIDQWGPMDVYKLRPVSFEQSPVAAIQTYGMAALRRMGVVPRATKILSSLPPPFGVAGYTDYSAELLDCIPPELVLEFSVEKGDSFVTESPPVDRRGYGVLEMLAHVQHDPDHPLSNLMSFQVPYTMKYAQPGVESQLVATSANTWRRDKATQRKHLQVLAHLFGKMPSMTLKFGGKAAGLKPGGRAQDHLWSVWTRIRKYFPKTNQHQGAFMLNTTLLLAAIAAVPSSQPAQSTLPVVSCWQETFVFDDKMIEQSSSSKAEMMLSFFDLLEDLSKHSKVASIANHPNREESLAVVTAIAECLVEHGYVSKE